MPSSSRSAVDGVLSIGARSIKGSINSSVRASYLDEHFRKIKAPDVEEIKAANARSGAALDRALNAARRQSKRSRNA